MKNKKRRYVIYYLALVCGGILYFLPNRLSLAVGRALGRISFRILPKYRKTTIENLRSVFGSERSQKEIDRIALKVFENLGMNGVEFIKLPRLSKGNIDEKVTLENSERLDKALRAGKGVIVLTAHFGNWEYVGAALRLKGYEGTVVVRRIYFEKYDIMLNRLRRSNDVRVIYRDESPKKALRVLKDNKILGIVADQDVDSVSGVFVNFLGKSAYTPAGPVLLAKASGARLVPCLDVRANGRHRLIVEEPIELEETSDKERDIRVNTQKWSDVIERYIRMFPEQWVWMHRRWKTRPTS